jgi:hypothetical protein
MSRRQFILCHMLLVMGGGEGVCTEKRMMGEVLGHGLVNYIDNKAKCRHLKNRHKGT